MKVTILLSFLATTGAGFHLPATTTPTPTSTSRHGLLLLEATRRGFLEETVGTLVMTATVVVGGRPNPSGAMEVGGKIQYGDEDIMSPKAHGTSEKAVQDDLLYGVSNKLADKICNFNRHFAEMGGYFRSTPFEDVVLEAKGPITFYDSVTGKPLFVAPIGRSAEDFIAESEVHGWPSFRDQEVCRLMGVIG